MSNTLYEPGQRVSVEVVANANGVVAGDGDLVEIVGETSGAVQVAAVETAGAAVGLLDRSVLDVDDTAFNAGDVVGTSMLKLRHAVDWVDTTDAYAAAAGDAVVAAVDGGVRAYDAAGGDTGDMVLGRVWTTNQMGTEYAGDIAVVRQR